MTKPNLLLELYSNLSTTGALTFSSKALVRKMVSQADLKGAKLIVEMGGGDGSITQGIVDEMDSSTELLVFEINPSFCEAMEKQFPQDNVHIINASADELNTYLKGRKVDFIFSSLPFSLIPKEVVDSILKQANSALEEGGAFIQICYSYLLKNLFQKYFNRVSVSFTLKNLPPAFVMVCHP
ncbi:class I SAM-dependent methyltransferase [Algoriphagus limi]|uniref:Methyltransferase domain-containing protein n=1 Tax=Algoriphagus limi TaxID=2975273 RepID=A0ABT2G399_9BACT|nr:methyltransferase domain-containing protein [Algoriphagus limi]MCS5489552.1 methyltransferase domain-containing protein [Algoriphagus limi]